MLGILTHKTCLNLYIYQNYYIMKMPFFRRCENFPVLFRGKMSCCVARYREKNTAINLFTSIAWFTMFYHRCLL